MQKELTLHPIATIETDFSEKFGVPRQSGRVEEALGRIVFLPPYRSREALRGILGFSHLWLLFDFSLSHGSGFRPTVRPPRLGGNRRVGVFASRSPFRPNPIGLSSVRLLSVTENEEEGPCLTVGGVDLVSGTPILDIKPYLPFTDSHPDATAGYAEEGLGHRLSVEIAEGLDLPLSPRELSLLCRILAEDPRPAYQEDASRLYHIRLFGLEVGFLVEGERLLVQTFRREG